MGDVVAEIEERGFVRTLKDLFAGAAGGVAQVLIGMTFDFFGFLLLPFAGRCYAILVCHVLHRSTCHCGRCFVLDWLGGELRSIRVPCLFREPDGR